MLPSAGDDGYISSMYQPIADELDIYSQEVLSGSAIETMLFGGSSCFDNNTRSIHRIPPMNELLPHPHEAAHSAPPSDSGHHVPRKNVRLSIDQWEELYRRHTMGNVSIKSLTYEFGVSRAQAYRIIKFKGVRPEVHASERRPGRPRILTADEETRLRHCEGFRLCDLQETVSQGLDKSVSLSTLSRARSGARNVCSGKMRHS